MDKSLFDAATVSCPCGAYLNLATVLTEQTVNNLISKFLEAHKGHVTGEKKLAEVKKLPTKS